VFEQVVEVESAGVEALVLDESQAGLASILMDRSWLNLGFLLVQGNLASIGCLERSQHILLWSKLQRLNRLRQNRCR
jgi:hypothetical protein